MTIGNLALCIEQTPDDGPADVEVRAALSGTIDGDTGDFLDMRLMCNYPGCPEGFVVANGLGMLAVETVLQEFTQHWQDVH